jgi:uncharacterized membrane protein SpoIIM required for sporulation
VPARAISARWIEKRKPHWSRLEALVAACGRGSVAALTHDEVHELALLYRQTAADLSTAREDPASAPLARYLNDLLGKSHNLAYSEGARARPSGAWSFYAREFPRIFRDTLPYTAAAFALFAAGMIAALAVAAADPGFERFVLNGKMMDTIERREMWTHGIVAVKPFASTAIMTNNITVSLAACATGMFAGIGTLYVMVFNGLLIGAVASACHRAGMGLQLWSFIAPHGTLELPAIFIAGGAGLILARGILAPGTLPRRDAVAAAGSTAIRLLLGVLPILVVAGLIEGFISPTDISPTVKFAIGTSMFVLLLVYLSSARKVEPRSGFSL